MQKAFSLASLERGRNLSGRASSLWLSGACPGFGASTLPPVRRAYLPLARGELRKCNATSKQGFGTRRRPKVCETCGRARRLGEFHCATERTLASGTRRCRPRSTASSIKQAGGLGVPKGVHWCDQMDGYGARRRPAEQAISTALRKGGHSAVTSRELSSLMSLRKGVRMTLKRIEYRVVSHACTGSQSPKWPFGIT